MSDKHIRDNPNTDKAKRTRLHTQRARPTLGLLLEHVAGPGGYQAAVWIGATEASREQDANLICLAGGTLRFSPFDEFVQQRNSIYELATRENVDGLIISSTVGSYTDQEEFHKFCDRYRPLPRVSIGMVVPGIPSVLVDNTQGMREAIAHLIETHGYRRIAFIRGPEGNEEAEQRYQVYTEVLAEHKLPLDPDLVTPGDFAPPAGTAAVRLLLDERKVGLQAIVAANDLMALAALEALQARGIRVPSDVAVVGFDDIEEAMIVTPSLTTVRQPTHKLGQQAVEVLLALLANKQVPERTTLPTELVVRQSCGCSIREVVQAAVGPVASAGESFEVALGARRETILSEVAHAVQASPDHAVYAGVEQLLDAFLAELQDESPGAFLSALEAILSQVAATGGEVVSWQKALSALRRCTLPHLGNKPVLSRAENLWQQSRVLIGEMALRAHAYRQWQAEQRTEALRGVSQSIITTSELTGLVDVIARELPQLGISSAHLSLYEGKDRPPEWSRLILAYDEKGPVELEAGGRRFLSRRLAPDGLLPRDRQYNIVVEPLYSREQQYGLALFEVGPQDGVVYETLRGQISSALRGALLLQERRRGEEALASERNLLHAMIDNLPDYIYVKDNEGHFVLGNTAVIRQMGLASLDDLVGKTDFDFFPQELAEPYYADEQRIIQSGEGLYEYEGPTLDAGEEKWVSTSKVPLRDAQGKIYGFVGLGRDITARKRAEEALARRALLLQTAAEVSRAASSILNVDELLPQVVELIRARFSLYYTGLFLVDEGRQWAVLRAGTGEPGRKMIEAGHKLPVGGASMIGWCTAQGQARIALDVGKDAVHFASPLLPLTRSEMALPLISRGQVIGAMTIQSDQPAAFTQEDVATLQTMADQIANATENARLFTEHARAEEALTQERYLMSAFMDNIPSHIYFKDTKSRFIRISKSQADRFGLSHPEQAVGKTDFDFFTEAHARPAYEAEQEIIRTGQPLENLEERETWADHPDTWVSTTKMPLRDETGNIVGTFGISMDITERKRAEEALAREQYLMQALMDNVPDYIYFKDRESRFLRISKSHARSFGLDDPVQAVGKTDFDFFTEEHARPAYENEQTIIQTGQPLMNKEAKDTRPGRPDAWVITTKMPMYDEEGNIIGTFGISRDITERKQVEEALARERNLLRSLIDNVPDYIYVKDTESRFITCNRSLARLMGVATPDEVVGKTDFDFYPPELAAKYFADEQAIFQSDQPLLEHEEPVVDVAGNPGWISTTKVPLRDAQGKVFGLVGMGRDITERKRLLTDLERRALQLQTAAEVSRAASSILNVDELLPQVVELIRARFNLYYTGLFLVDETGQWIVLRAGTGEAGRKMIEAGHQLPVGGTSLLSSCIAQGKASVALDVEKAARYENPYLPETRSEMALPLISRGRAIGAMTIQSAQPAAFTQEDITTLQTMADQLANAIENAVLFDESKRARLLLDQRVKGLDCLNDIGRKLEETVPLPNFLQWVTERIPPIMQYPDLCVVAIEYREQVYGVPAALTLPRQMVQGLRIRGESVGRLCIAYTEEHDFLDEESALLGDIARRVNSYLENQRLLSETQARARREQTLREITARVRSSTDPDTVMRTLAGELGTALGKRTLVRLVAPGQIAPPSSGASDDNGQRR